MSRFGNLVPWTYFMMNQSSCLAAILVLIVGPLLFAQNQDSTSGEHEPTSVGKGIDYLFNYLNMAGTMQASEFRPLTQRERTHLYLKTMVNPLGYIKAGFSAGLDQWKDKPPEWEQGASGYGRRFANIVGQYSIQRTVTFGLSQRITRRQPLFQFWQEGPLAAHWVRAGKWHAFAARQWKPASVDFPSRRRGRRCFLVSLLAASESALGGRCSRQLRHHHGEQYGVWSIERISS